ncbi:MAG: helix-turn-helix domain-containing protein [Saccharofermentans sp.]|nr:helix-turn-helix domain-containing protein [Saccharofermentans sp.]
MNVRPEYNFKVIGRNLKKLRHANNLTVEEVREYMQLGTVQAIYKWERGEGLPQADSLMALMYLYGTDKISDIYGGSKELPSSFAKIIKLCVK